MIIEKTDILMEECFRVAVVNFRLRRRYTRRRGVFYPLGIPLNPALGAGFMIPSMAIDGLQRPLVVPSARIEDHNMQRSMRGIM